MLESDGIVDSARIVLPRPSTATSSGTVKPIAKQASQTCRATASVDARMASGFVRREGSPAVQALLWRSPVGNSAHGRIGGRS